MMLSLPSLPRITIWFQAKAGGRRLPEHLAPGFDESCRYLEYKPSEDFIFLIHTERKDDALPQRLGFMIEIDGKDTSYFPVSAPGGFGADGRGGKSHTVSVRHDFAPTKQLFRFPASETLGQIIIRVFILKPLVNVPTSTAGINIYRWLYTTRDIRQYRILSDYEVRALTASEAVENMLFKHSDDEPAAVFRFKPRTYKQLQELSVITSSVPVPKPPKAPVAAPFPTVAEQPAQAFPKSPNHQYVYPPVPKPFPTAVERLVQPIQRKSSQPPESIKGAVVNLPPLVGQASAQTRSKEQDEPRLQRLESYRKELAALKQKLGHTEELPAQTGLDEHGQPCLHLLESYRKESNMRRILAPVDGNLYTPPAVPQFGSVPSVSREIPAQAPNSKAAEQPIGTLPTVGPGQKTALGLIGGLVKMAPNWASTWGPVLPPSSTIPWVSIWGTSQTVPPLASCSKENASLTVNPNTPMKEVESSQGVKRKREEPEERDDDETVIQRPAKRMCVGQ